MNTFSELSKRMKGRLLYEASKLEGSWTADNIQAVANELARIYAEDIDTILDKAFVSTAYGEWLDLACDDYGITRNPATYAEVYLQITGRPGAYAPVRVAADDIIFLTDAFVLPDTGEALVRAVCEQPGEAGNVLPGVITKILDNTLRLDKAVNPSAASGGYDIESGESLAARTLERIRTPSTSGNIADYRKWSLSVSGVEKVKVFPLARGNGTVDVVIIADNNTFAPDILLEKVSDYIEEQRPIGADVQVTSAEPVEIILDANVVKMDGYTADDIKGQLYEQLQVFLASLAFSSTVLSYLKMADLLFSCSGVADVTSYTLNTQTVSISITERQFPVAAMPVITVRGD